MSPLRRIAIEMGMGTSLRRQDCTQAAVRALQDAIWRTSLTAARELGKSGDDMHIEVLIGVPRPEEVDKERVRQVLPYGHSVVKCVAGGLEIPTSCGTGSTIMANAAAIVSLDLP